MGRASKLQDNLDGRRNEDVARLWTHASGLNFARPYVDPAGIEGPAQPTTDAARAQFLRWTFLCISDERMDRGGRHGRSDQRGKWSWLVEMRRGTRCTIACARASHLAGYVNVSRDHRTLPTTGRGRVLGQRRSMKEASLPRYGFARSAQRADASRRCHREA
nr:hypothetical protein CFP56_13324 [Quercus suber]